MKIFGLTICLSRKKPAREPRTRPRNSSPWLRKIAKEESTKKLIDGMVQNNAVIQAAIVYEATGIEIDPADIKILTPQEAFEQALVAEVIKDLSNDKDLIERAKRIMMERARQDIGKHFGLDDGYAGQPPKDWMAEFEKFEAFRARLGGGSALQTVLNSKVLTELIKTIVPLIVGGQPGAQIGAKQPPDMFVVEIDGQLVEMTPQEYDAYKRPDLPGGKTDSHSPQAGTGVELGSGADTSEGADSLATPAPSTPLAAPSEGKTDASAIQSPASAAADRAAKPAGSGSPPSVEPRVATGRRRYESASRHEYGKEPSRAMQYQSERGAGPASQRGPSKHHRKGAV